MKVYKTYIWGFVGVLLLSLLLFLVSKKYSNEICTSLDVSITDSSEIGFVSSNKVLEILTDKMPDIVGTKMDSVNIAVLDSVLRQQPFIKKVNIYKTINGHLNVELTQRKPLIRCNNTVENNFYVDEDGVVFPISDDYTPKVLVVSGYLKENFDFSNNKIHHIYLDSLGLRQITDVFYLAKLIRDDDFWRDQIEQVYVNNNYEYELVPMVGNHVLVLGSIDDFDKKMYLLKQFYYNGLKKKGWNTYREISVKYNNQIVCKKW